MLEANLDELVGPDLIRKFRELWNVDAEVAQAEMLEILSVFSEPQDEGAIEAFVARMIVGLVGEQPHASSWFEMIAAGSTALRPEQEYAYSTKLKSRARLLSRQRPMFLGPIEDHRRAWAEEVTANQEGVRLILFSAIAKELRRNIAAKAALGPAWPLMVAVNDDLSVDEKRQLYWFGADNRLQSLLSEAARTALADFVELYGSTYPDPPQNGDWRRSLPPGVDAGAYFEAAGMHRSDKAEIDGETEDLGCLDPVTAEPPAPAPAPAPKFVSPQPELQDTFTYLKNDDGSGLILRFTSEDLARLEDLMPLLKKKAWCDEMGVAATRARIRHMAYQALGKRAYGPMYDEAAMFRDRGLPPPPTLMWTHASLFEEEICLGLVWHSRNLGQLQEFGFLRGFDAASIPDDVSKNVERWMDFNFRRWREMAEAESYEDNPPCSQR